ncbi:MAG: hypothetical protein GXO48_01430 [Chlorobi bacterium]|nr:hypothetical protein [Chlorobiota bacterium]
MFLFIAVQGNLLQSKNTLKLDHWRIYESLAILEPKEAGEEAGLIDNYDEKDI